MEENLFDEAPRAETTLRDYLRVLFRQKAAIILCFITVLTTVFIGLTMKTPVYEARVKVLITGEKQIEATYYNPLVGNQRGEAGLTQSEIVKSAPVLERAVEALRLYQKPADYERAFASPLKNKILDLKLKMKKASMERMPAQQQMAVRYRQAVESLRNSLSVEPMRDTNIFVITARDFDPVGAAVIANVVSRSYVIFDLEQQLAELQLKYGNKHPTVLQMQDNIDQMTKNLSGAPLPSAEAIGPASVKIIEQADLPLAPTGQRKMLVMILALFMSIFLGVMLAFIFEYMDQTIKTPREIEDILGLSLLGSIPRLKRRGKRILMKIKGRAPARYAAAYQNLCDQISLLIRNKHFKTLLVTAAEEREGVSTVVLNLGEVLSRHSAKRVLVIDANYRVAAKRKAVKVDEGPGLVDVLTGSASLDKILVEVNPMLFVAPSGDTQLNPVTFLDSPQMRAALEQAKAQFDVILIDCPDLTKYKDPQILAPLVDQVVLVVRECATRRQVIQRAVGPLKAKNIPVLGAVLNGRTYPIPRFVYERV